MIVAEKRWFKDPDNANRLRELLDNPTLVEAFRLVFDTNRPQSSRGETAIGDNALNNARTDGLYEFKHTLERLANPTQETLIRAGVKELKSKPPGWTQYREEQTSWPIDLAPDPQDSTEENN